MEPRETQGSAYQMELLGFPQPLKGAPILEAASFPLIWLSPGAPGTACSRLTVVCTRLPSGTFSEKWQLGDQPIFNRDLDGQDDHLQKQF